MQVSANNWNIISWVQLSKIRGNKLSGEKRISVKLVEPMSEVAANNKVLFPGNKL